MLQSNISFKRSWYILDASDDMEVIESIRLCLMKWSDGGESEW